MEEKIVIPQLNRTIYASTQSSLFNLQVEAVFTLSFSHLLQEKNQGYTHYCRDGVYRYTMPVFLHGPHRVWGLTAVITDLTLEMLAPGKYHRRTYVKGQL